jgi:hypothetical protein
MVFKSIEEEWCGYAAMVFKGMKPKPSQVQVEETKQAFFAGAWAILNAVVEIGEPHIPEEFGMAYLDGRRKEIEAFKNRLMAKYAERN